MTLLKLIIIVSLFCNGLHQATSNQMIFEGFKVRLFGALPDWIFKPLIGCIYCMSSLYSILGLGIYYLIYSFDINLLYLLPVMICCVCAMNGIIYNLIND